MVHKDKLGGSDPRDVPDVYNVMARHPPIQVFSTGQC